MPLELKELEGLKIAAITTKRIGGVDWDGLFESLCKLGLGNDNSGYSVGDVHLMTRNFATVEFPSDGYPISRQRVYRKMNDWWKERRALRFMHRNAKDFRFAFQDEKFSLDDERVSEYLYHGE